MPSSCAWNAASFLFGTALASFTALAKKSWWTSAFFNASILSSHVRLKFLRKPPTMIHCCLLPGNAFHSLWYGSVVSGDCDFPIYSHDLVEIKSLKHFLLISLRWFHFLSFFVGCAQTLRVPLVPRLSLRTFFASQFALSWASSYRIFVSEAPISDHGCRSNITDSRWSRTDFT